MNAAAGNLSGVLPVLQTPYFDDESIDFETLTGEIDWLMAAGANGVVMAMVSETLRLSTPERQQMAEHVCRADRTWRDCDQRGGRKSAHRDSARPACRAMRCYGPDGDPADCHGGAGR